MNERIKQLAQQAGMYVDLNGNSWPKSMSAEECEAAYKKFAELIVQECIGVVQKGGGMCGAISSNNLKQHFFGVEE